MLLVALAIWLSIEYGLYDAEKKFEPTIGVYMCNAKMDKGNKITRLYKEQSYTKKAYDHQRKKKTHFYYLLMSEYQCDAFKICQSAYLILVS